MASIALKLPLAALCAVALAGCAATVDTFQPFPQSAAAWAEAAQVQDDPLEPAINVKSGGPLARKLQSNTPGVNKQYRHLAVSIDRRTGALSAGVLVWFEHRLGGWSNPLGASYLVRDGLPVDRAAQRIHTDVDCGPAYCTYTEAVFVAIPQSDWAGLVDAYKAGKPPSQVFVVRVRSARGNVEVAFEWPEVVETIGKAQSLAAPIAARQS